jgi:hypothetical protein
MKNKLITLSLVCLRTCLEALRSYPASMSRSSHLVCTGTYCKIQFIKDLKSSLKCFLEELSAVFFKKDNLRSKSWWLSAFYAFSIQSMVRAGLKLLLVDVNPANFLIPPVDHRWPTIQNYLSVALHLFIATSSNYDPLMKDYSIVASTPVSKAEEEKTSDEYFTAAQVAVKQNTWNSNGIASSMQYLQTLFRDGGEV